MHTSCKLLEIDIANELGVQGKRTSVFIKISMPKKYDSVESNM